MAWSSTVPYISAGEDASAAVLDRPLKVLADRTEWLKGQLDTLTNKSAVVARSVSVASTVTVGDLVYFDAVEGQYDKALAEWSATLGAEGELLPGVRAFVKGLVVVKAASNTADVLRIGDWTDAVTVLAALGASPEMGVYYLSADTPGAATLTAPPLKTQVITYEGGDTLSVQVVGHPQPNHVHRRYTLAESWLEPDDPDLADMDPPTDAVYGYDVTADADLSALFVAYPGEITLFGDGTLVDPAKYETNRWTIWWMSATTEPAADMTAFAYSPMAHDEPVIRGVVSATPESLTAVAAAGVLTLTELPFTQTAATHSATAVSSISGRTQQMTTIVSGLTAGSGAHVANFSDGRAVVSLDTTVDAQIDADIYNLNNAVEDSSGDWISVLLPRGRISSLTGRVPLPKLSTTAYYQVTAFAWIAGAASQSALTVRVAMTESPRITGYKVIAGPTLDTTLAAAGSDSSLAYYRETTEALDLTAYSPSEGALFVKLTSDGAADTRVIRFGAIVAVIGAVAIPDPASQGLATRVVIAFGLTNAVVQSLTLPESGGATWEYTLRLGAAQRTGTVLGSVAPDGDVHSADDPSTSDAGSGSTDEVSLSVDYVPTVGDTPGVIRLLCTNLSATQNAILTVYGVVLDTTEV